MITIGVEAHKHLPVARALDDQGTVLGDWRGPTCADGWASIHQWATTFVGARQWGIEGSWNYGRGLAQYLVATGETCYEINPRWTAQCRQHTRKVAKTDQLDAQAVARLVREDARTLPRVTCEDETTLLDLLTTEREGALAEATRLRNQLDATAGCGRAANGHPAPAKPDAGGGPRRRDPHARTGTLPAVDGVMWGELAHGWRVGWDPRAGAALCYGCTTGGLCGRSPIGRLVGWAGAPPTESRRESAMECHSVPDGADPGALCAGRSSLHRPATSSG